MKVIRWNEPRFGNEELEEVSKVIKANYVNEGPKTKELEEMIQGYLKVKHAILTTNGTAALFLAIKADSIIKGKTDFEVIIPDMTMIATATAVSWAGGKPVLVDVEKERTTIDCEKIRDKITSKTTAILPVQILGRSSNMGALQKIAEEFNLSIIEDAAGALGSKYSDGRYLGTIGKVGCYSMQSNKIITSGQGGIVVTDDDEYYEEMRRIRDFGRKNNKEFLHQKEGYNLKFSDLAAALAVAQFRKIEDRKVLLLNQRQQYQSELTGINEITFPKFKEGEIPLWVDVYAKNRKALNDYLISKSIYCREYWPAVHRNPPYADQGTDKDFPVSSFISDNGLWLPNGPGVSKEDIKEVCKHIREFYKK